MRQLQYFGLGNAQIIRALRDIHADFSVDSTAWLVGGKYGLAIDQWGQQRPANESGFDWSKDAILQQNVRTMRKWVEAPLIAQSSNSQQQPLWEVGA
jgi:hypothetical protein